MSARSRKMSAAVLAATIAALAAVLAFAVRPAAAGPSWGPETPPFNLQVVLRDVTGGPGFGHVKFRQPNDADKIVYLDTWVRDLAPGSYVLQRAIDTTLDGNCPDAGWLDLGTITTDDNGTGRGDFSRALPAPLGTQFDIHFRVVVAGTASAVLASECYRFTVSL